MPTVTEVLEHETRMDQVEFGLRQFVGADVDTPDLDCI
jgi:hypothetical protein